MRLIRYIYLLVLIPSLSNAQTRGMDTIFCSLNNTTSLFFKDNVTLLNIGNTDDFFGEVKVNIVNIKPSGPNGKPTTILVRTSGDNVFYGILSYSPRTKKFFYDFASIPENKSSDINGAAPSKLDSGNVKQVKILNKDKIATVKGLRNELVNIGCISPNFDAGVTNIRNDNDNTYLKLVLKNKSSIPFKLDFISFQYFQEMKKGTFKQSRKAPVDVFPINEQSIKEISPDKTEALVYAIPIWALSDNGYLMILIREEKGDRKIKIKVDGTTIQQAKQLE